MLRQAIALIVNTPADMGAIAGKIDDALKARDKAGVNLALVQQAKNTLASNDMHRVRRLLEAAIGARVHTGRKILCRLASCPWSEAIPERLVPRIRCPVEDRCAAPIGSCWQRRWLPAWPA